MELLLSLGGVAGLWVTGLLFCYGAHRFRSRAAEVLRIAEQKALALRNDADNEKRDAHHRLKEELRKRRSDFDFEIKRERLDLECLSNRLSHRQEQITERHKQSEALHNEALSKERAVARNTEQLKVAEQRVKTLQDDLVQRLEHVSSMTQDEARKVLCETLENEVQHAQAKWLQKVEEEARLNAKRRSMQIVIDAMQRYTAEHVTPHSSGVVHLPSDDMKGRIIGKEGRNIKALEMATGMEFVIGDTPEIITISGFNPIRREVARRSLEKLMLDGRINPTRIEEIVAKTEGDIEEIIHEKGTEAIMQFNLQGVKPEIVELLGKLHFRTSFSQNVLTHSIEVASLARMIAHELGLHPEIAVRAGLFHDMGKALSAEQEGPHALIGAEVARRCGEDPLVVNAIAAHHEEVPFISLYDPIIVIADSISASRPGARRETMTAYIKRLEKLEDLANRYQGVRKSYALQAGREIRVIVEESVLSDDESHRLARDLARDVEREMAFPGQIKINVIREKRSIEYAR